MNKIIAFFLFLFLLKQVSAQRNVLVIVADDLSGDYFGFLEGHQDTVDVPNIRMLSKKGVRFTRAYANPVCSATRASILTGRYGFRTGVGGIVGGTGGSASLDTAEKTIPKLLKQYNTNIAKAHIGKWHLQSPQPISNLLFPNKMGYDHFEGPFIGTLTSYTNWTKCTNGVNSTITNYATSENVNNAVSWLKTQNSSKPFFLWLAFNAPHDPLHLPPAGLHTFSNLSGTAIDIRNQPKAYFKAMIQAMDHEIGRLFDSLRVLNKMDSTDIIFIGDNGNTPRTAQIADTSRAKGTLYEYGIHVPFITAGPSVVNGGRASDALINATDIFATTLELMGFSNWQSQIPVAKPVDSKSLLPIINNTATAIRQWAFSENFKLTPDSNDGKTMRNEEYKLIRFDYGAEEFYNLTTDPSELNDLVSIGQGSWSGADVINYNMLCGEMRNLLNSTTVCNIVTPVKLVSFTGKIAGRQTKLFWSTAVEENSNRFEIERSMNGLEFIKIGSLKTKDNSSSLTQYSFNDISPLAGNNYYRLKQVDNDGKFTYSKIINIMNIGDKSALKVYPNPAKSKLVLEKNEAFELGAFVSISNMLGQVISTSAILGGFNQYMLETSGLSNGTYLLNIIERNRSTTIKISVAH